MSDEGFEDGGDRFHHFLIGGPVRGHMNWKYVGYSLSIGIAVTVLSLLLYKQGGALFIWPGIFMELVINGLMLFIIHSDDWYSLPSGAYLVLNLHSTHSSYSSFCW